jgi:hypothetical protein
VWETKVDRFEFIDSGSRPHERLPITRDRKTARALKNSTLGSRRRNGKLDCDERDSQAWNRYQAEPPAPIGGQPPDVLADAFRGRAFTAASADTRRWPWP